jgi:hypothetical protein
MGLLVAGDEPPVAVDPDVVVPPAAVDPDVAVPPVVLPVVAGIPVMAAFRSWNGMLRFCETCSAARNWP